ncbi:MAG: hypothetical protein IT385_22660 [Deltaproteobacteria bacterium]|nr:hypothetical protein [Deltaproteobacteria bacterium]
MESLLFEQSRPDGAVVLSAIIDRRTGELAFVGEATALSAAEVEELRGHARGGTEGLLPLDLGPARLRLARAILASRIAGRAVPAWLMEHAELVGDPCHPSSRVDDVYLCGSCDAPLPADEQLALAHRAASAREVAAPRCPTCRGELARALPAPEVWLARAWLMMAADLPHRALVCAARAEATRAPQSRLDIVRGLAHLRLEQGPQALAHFARAAKVATAGGAALDRRLAVWLSRAQDLVDRTEPVRTARQRDRTVPTPVPGHASSRAIAPVPAFA